MLIVTEGGKTEPLYFNDLKRHRRLTSVEITPSEYGNNPKSVVEYAVHRKAEARRAGARYDRVWCVFDHDNHEWIADAMQQASAHSITIAFSNPCIEIWFLLHFRYSSGHLSVDEALEELRKLMPGYGKAMPTYHALAEMQVKALAQADTLCQYHEGCGNKPIANPSTTVGELVRFLNSLALKYP